MYGDNGKENGKYRGDYRGYTGLHWGYLGGLGSIGILEKKTETTI